MKDELKKYSNLPDGSFRQFAAQAKLPFTLKRICSYGDLVELYWESNRHEHPILTELALRILNAPSSSSVMERTFGKISRYVTKQRNNLKSKTLACFVKFDEYEVFEKSASFHYKKHGEQFEPLVWTMADDNLSSEYDYLDGLIDE